MNGTNSSATQKLCFISHLARFWADNGQAGSYASGRTLNDAGPKSAWGKRPAVECRSSPKFPEARFWLITKRDGS